MFSIGESLLGGFDVMNANGPLTRHGVNSFDKNRDQ
jgi:hypothetical protein